MSEESIVQVEQAGLGEYRGANGLPSANAESVSSSNLEKIKELLFGAQMREQEKRLLRLEERLTREYSELQSDLGQRLSAIELDLRQDLVNLSAAMTAEQRQREDALRTLNDQTKNAFTEVGKQIDQLVEQTAQQQQELRQQIQAQSETLEEEIQQNYQQILAVLERRVGEMQAGKVDRVALASLFRELALKVNNHDVSDSH